LPQEAHVKELVWHRQLLPAVDRNATRPFLTDTGTGTTTTYGEHGARVLRLANALRKELGVEPGDRVAVMSLNSAGFEELYHAGMLGACVLNPLNLRFAPRELTHVLADSATKVVFVDVWFAGVIDQVRAAAGVQTVVLMGEGDGPHDHRYEDLIAAGEEIAPVEPEEEDPALLMYTGGTTGLPKGVLLTQRNLMLTAYHIGMTIRVERDDVYLAQVPMFHAASLGVVLAMPTTGGKVVTVPVFDPGGVMKAAEAHGATNTIMVPTMLAMTFAHPEYAPSRLSSLQRLTYGASPMPRPVLERLRADLPHVQLFQGYGMTESAALVCVLMPEDHEREDKLASAGRPVAGTVISIQDELGARLPPGQVGEVCIRGGQFMREYWRRPEETEAAFYGGWYHSGDAGYLDDEGFLFLVDRTKDMIVTGGENVYSTEVEQALAAHPAVAQAAVIGIPDDTWGEAVHAVVVPKPDSTVTGEDLIEHARGLIAGYKVPKSVEFRAEPLPLSGAMKVLKRELRAPYWEGRQRRVN
jgi:long-chain acyl-CoA synthetase